MLALELFILKDVGGGNRFPSASDFLALPCVDPWYTVLPKESLDPNRVSGFTLHQIHASKQLENELNFFIQTCKPLFNPNNI